MISELTTYTITATNTAGSLDVTVKITVKNEYVFDGKECGDEQTCTDVFVPSSTITRRLFERSPCSAGIPDSDSIKDQGYYNLPRGWYDTENCGKCTSYCRWVGGYGPPKNIYHFNPSIRTFDENKGIWWSCAKQDDIGNIIQSEKESFGTSFNIKKCTDKDQRPT